MTAPSLDRASVLRSAASLVKFVATEDHEAASAVLYAHADPIAAGALAAALASIVISLAGHCDVDVPRFVDGLITAVVIAEGNTGDAG